MLYEFYSYSGWLRALLTSYNLVALQLSGEKMMRLLRMSTISFSSTPPRRQNFFELNPIFPDHGQKDFDIYNVNCKKVKVSDLTINDENRSQQLRQKLTREVYLAPILQKSYGKKNVQYELDEEFGFPIGIHENFDNFIEVFKREKKVGSNIVGQFQNLVMTLMKKFEAKSQLQLIKIFRLNLANSKKDEFKSKIRSLVINSAFIRFIKERKEKEIPNSTLTIQDLEQFSSAAKRDVENQTNEISKEELQEVVTVQVLKELDEKIKKVQEEIQAKAISDGTYIPTYHPKYGMAINEEVQINQSYDFNFPRGHLNVVTSNQPLKGPHESQDRFIEARINKLFFAQALKQLQQKRQIQPEKMADIHNLPLNIRSKDKIINSLLYKYKQYDLLIEPDLNDIYGEIDIVLKKIAVKVVPDYISNDQENTNKKNTHSSPVRERYLSKDVLLWRTLDAEQIFEPELYTENQVNKVKVDQKQLAELSPAAQLEISLNKMPFNLYRHSDLDNFAVFNKYKKRIYQDYLTDKTIDPAIEFKYFSLEEASNKLKKIKKPEQIPDKFYGWARRKSGEAEVFVVKGNGKVIVNGQPLADYFGDVYHRGQALKPLIFTETAGQYDLEFVVVGGGIHSQSECMAMALTKALIMINPRYEKILASFGLVGTDDRVNEPKRIGLYSARVRPPYVRR